VTVVETLVLTRRDITGLGIGMPAVIQAVEDALRQQGEGKVLMPPRAALPWRPGGRLNGNAAYIESPPALGIKWNAEVPDNVRRGLPNLTALVILNDPDTGFPIAVLEGSWITAMRTAAVSAVAARFLAPRMVAVMGLVGCGVQMRTQLLALDALLKPQIVRIFDIEPEAMHRFADQMRDRVAGAIQEVDSAEQAVVGADVVVSATRFETPPPPPSLRDAWLKAGALALPIDVDRAWEPAAYKGVSKFLTDRWDMMQVAATRGNFPAGLPTLYAELHEVVSGRKPGRERDDERIMAMNEGMPIDDMALGRLVYERAVQAEAGIRVPFVESTADVYSF
jgi:ornithine cyclodeaminase/alanine dehydrogenase-like protein (mu-crystallin family)